MSIYEIALALVLFAAGIGTGWAGQRLLGQVAGLKKQVRQLEEDVKGQKEKQTKQEAELQALRDRRRLPHAAADGLEDAIAIVLDVLQEEEATRAYREARVGQLHHVLKQIRQEPAKYREQENQKRLYAERKKG